MFLFKYFRKSFDFKNLLTNLKLSKFKILIYFIFIIVIANFPLSYQTIKNNGGKLDFIAESFKKEVPLNWDLPDDIIIKGGKLISNNDKKQYVNKHGNITYIINLQKKLDNINNYKNHIILSEENILFIDDKANFLEVKGYLGFDNDEFKFKELKLASGQEKVAKFNEFGLSLEKSFSKYTIAYTLFRNIVVQIFINIIYVLILSCFIMLFKFKYEKFLSFGQTINFVVLAMGLPSILAFFIGLLSFPFGPVVFQLTVGLIIMMVLLINGRKTFS